MLLSLLLSAARAQAETYYSTGGPISTSPTASCNGLNVCSGVSTSVTTPAGSAAIAAAVYLPTSGTAKLRFQLNGTGRADYRAGVVLAEDAASLSLNTISNLTIRTYNSALSTTVPQESRVVTSSALQAQLLAGNGDPVQVDFTAAADFDQVEVEFASVAKLGSTVNVSYAYGTAPNKATQVVGFTSNSSSTTPNQYSVSGCSEKITSPASAADNSQANYATFSSLLSVNCNPELQVSLNGTAPGTYKAGFVIGKNNTLLDASVLSGLTLHTYKNGVLQETASGASLLGLSVLPDSKSLVSFQATKEFDAVSIQRTDVAAALDNLQLYYGVGVASTTPPQVISSGFTDGKPHYTTSTSGACLQCGVSNAGNATGDPNAAATITVGVGVTNRTGLVLDLNGTGAGGNRAGMVIGGSSLLDANALSRITLSTYDSNGALIETASGSSLLQVNLLPDGRQTLSFNTTKNFVKVGIQVSGLVSALSTTDVYYAFTDNSNGSIVITTPVGPLPVVLTSFGVRRLAGTGAAEISWATASEQNSARFVVERSATPAEGFAAIGQVAAAGTSAGRHAYSLRDEAAATQAGPLYYRLRQIDADGRATLSAVAVLAAGPVQAGFTLYPNPAPATAQVVRLSTGSPLAAGYTISLYSGAGQLLSSQLVDGRASAATIGTAGLAPGLYHVVLRDAAGLVVSGQRLVVAGY
ncbi:MAG: T9SS type A sorting domain-containing protein [Janthinobacterium lividum]